jgi:hypothetical protein
MTGHRPPRLAEWLLTRCVWPDERVAVLGDLDEQFHEQVVSAGAARAARWYWREALRLVWGFCWWALRIACQRAATMATDDVRYALRRLRRQPVTSLVSVATLACAIGAAAATWTLVSAVLLHPLPFLKEPDRLVSVAYLRNIAGERRTTIGSNYPDYVALRNAAPMRISAWGSIGSSAPITLSTNGQERPIGVLYASHDLLDLLGVRTSLGRFFSDSDDQRGAPLVAVLSDRAWRRQFDSDPNVIGRVIHVRDRPATIVGVLPRAFRSLEVGRSPDLFLPLHAIDQIQSDNETLFGPRPSLYWINAVGRLPQGVTARQMSGRLNGLQLDPANEQTFLLNDVEAAALSATSRASVSQFSRLLGTTVAMLLAIGSITVGMLLVLRTDARRGELAMCITCPRRGRDRDRGPAPRPSRRGPVAAGESDAVRGPRGVSVARRHPRRSARPDDRWPRPRRRRCCRRLQRPADGPGRERGRPSPQSRRRAAIARGGNVAYDASWIASRARDRASGRDARARHRRGPLCTQRRARAVAESWRRHEPAVQGGTAATGLWIRRSA